MSAVKSFTKQRESVVQNVTALAAQGVTADEFKTQNPEAYGQWKQIPLQSDRVQGIPPGQS